MLTDAAKPSYLETSVAAGLCAGLLPVLLLPEVLPDDVQGAQAPRRHHPLTSVRSFQRMPGGVGHDSGVQARGRHGCGQRRQARRTRLHEPGAILGEPLARHPPGDARGLPRVPRGALHRGRRQADRRERGGAAAVVRAADHAAPEHVRAHLLARREQHERGRVPLGALGRLRLGRARHGLGQEVAHAVVGHRRNFGTA